MTRHQSELSFTDRLIIQLIRFRTRDARHRTFFGDNKYIASCVDIKPDTARKSVTKLVKLGYLQKFLDKQGRRHLMYTGKEYVPVIENLSNMDKRYWKNIAEKNYNNYMEIQREYSSARTDVVCLQNKVKKLQQDLSHAAERAGWLEFIFTSRGLTSEQIDILIEESRKKWNESPTSNDSNANVSQEMDIGSTIEKPNNIQPTMQTIMSPIEESSEMMVETPTLQLPIIQSISYRDLDRMAAEYEQSEEGQLMKKIMDLSAKLKGDRNDNRYY